MLPSSRSSLARQLRVAIAVADGKEWDGLEEPTSDFMYGRLHGDDRTYFSNDALDALVPCTDHIAGWGRGHLAADAPQANDLRPVRAKDVYVTFDNTALGHATTNALTLRALLGSSPRARRPRADGPRKVA